MIVEAPAAAAAAAEGSDDASTCVPDIDARGVDRAQIRRMLALPAIERLRWLEEFVRDIVELRRLNEKHTVR